MALSAFQNSWVTWRKIALQSFFINTPSSCENKTQQLLENKPHGVDKVGTGVVQCHIPSNPLILLWSWKTLGHSGSSPWDALETHLEPLGFVQQFKST